jgi:hypothetical protein
MSEGKNTKEAALKKTATETKAVETKTEAPATTESKPDAASKKQGMGEGQKPVSKAYKDNWNDIFGKKKKR